MFSNEIGITYRGLIPQARKAEDVKKKCFIHSAKAILAKNNPQAHIPTRRKTDRYPRSQLPSIQNRETHKCIFLIPLK
jgi:hypothetical protein